MAYCLYIGNCEVVNLYSMYSRVKYRPKSHKTYIKLFKKIYDEAKYKQDRGVDERWLPFFVLY